MTKKVVDFYMGANSPDGFNTFYNELEIPYSGWRSFLIKGGAGTGKSSLMKRICTECGENETLIEKIHCSSDPNSLDGIILYDKKISVLDATPPHVIEPTYPGGYQTVINLCEYFDEDKLSARLDETIKYQTQNNACHKKCCNLLKCANILLKDNYNYIEKHTDFNKIKLLVNRIIKKEFKRATSQQGIEHKRLLSAVTNQGVKTYVDTPHILANKIYLIKDEYGVSSNEILSLIRKYAIQKGFEIYSCYCALNQHDKLEHLFIPQLDLGFVTSSKYNDLSNIKPYTVISYTRFTDVTALKQKKQLLNFNKKAAMEIINAAVDVLRYAKEIHDSLELQFANAVDFNGVDKKVDEVINKIKAR